MAQTHTKKRGKRSPPNGDGDWKQTFLAALGNTANVRYAAAQAGIAREYAYQVKREDEAFAAAWALALEDAIEALELVALQRAQSQSDVLLIFLLKSHRPEKYRDHFKHEHTGKDGGPIETKELSYAERLANLSNAFAAGGVAIRGNGGVEPVDTQSTEEAAQGQPSANGVPNVASP
jgi:hypothetical protein